VSVASSRLHWVAMITDFFFFLCGAEGDTTPRGALVLTAFGVGGISRYFRSSDPFQGRQMSLNLW
jgi:hypothetical protein